MKTNLLVRCQDKNHTQTSSHFTNKSYISSGNLVFLVLLLELLQLLLLLLALDEARLLLRLFLTVTWASVLGTSESVFFFVCFEVEEFLFEHLLLGLDLRDFDLFFLTCKASSRVYVYKISSSSSAALFSSSFFRAWRWPSSQSFFAISTSSCEKTKTTTVWVWWTI